MTNTQQLLINALQLPRKGKCVPRLKIRWQRLGIQHRSRQVAEQGGDLVGLEAAGLKSYRCETGDPFIVIVVIVGIIGYCGQSVHILSGMRHQCHASEHALDLADNLIVCCTGKFAADRRLKGTEVTVHAEAVQEEHFFFEDFVAGALEGGGCRADVVFGGAEFAGEPELDGGVHAAVEFGQDEESASEGFAEG